MEQEKKSDYFRLQFVQEKSERFLRKPNQKT